MAPGLSRRLVAEGLGTGGLVAAVVGSGIMAERLSGGSGAIALLCNTLATGAALVAIILALGSVSGAHLNPAVTLCSAGIGEMPWGEAPWFVTAQIGGAVSGTVLAHAMFGEPLVSLSTHARSGFPQVLSECVATFGLLATIRGCSRHRPAAVPFAVSSYIVAAYWFTASTSFANPAVTIARALTATFTGIRLQDVPAFIAAQILGAAAAAWLFTWLAPATAVSRTPAAKPDEEVS